MGRKVDKVSMSNGGGFFKMYFVAVYATHTMRKIRHHPQRHFTSELGHPPHCPNEKDQKQGNGQTHTQEATTLIQ